MGIGARVLSRILVFVLLPACAFAQSSNYGFFEGSVEARWNDEDARSMTLIKPFAYIDPASLKWLVPTNTVIDGASIPQGFWSVIGGPFEGTYRNASVVHDYYCDAKTRPWRDVHRMFYYAMLAGGTTVTKAKVMYYAVMVGGPRWTRVHHTNHEPRMVPKPGDIDRFVTTPWKVAYDKQRADADMQWIESENPSLQDIELRVENAFQGEAPPSKVMIE